MTRFAEFSEIAVVEDDDDDDDVFVASVVGADCNAGATSLSLED